MNDSNVAPAHRTWWLVTRRRRAEWQSLIATGVGTFTGRSRSHFEAVQPGDPVFLYVSKPDHAILAVATVSENGTLEHGAEGLPPEESDGRSAAQIGVQLAFEVPNGISWRDIADEPELADSEPIRQRSSGTLFPLSVAEYSALQLLALERNPELASAFSALDAGTQNTGSAPSSEEEEPAPSRVMETQAGYDPPRRTATLPPVRDLAELQALTSLPFEWLEEVRDLLEDAGQIILTGPPGTGKTWLARGLAALAAGDPERVHVVQFHPSTSYEDFVEGLKPQVDARGNVTYAVLPGIFVRLCEAARADPDHHYVLLIDEINRTPLARVFGELLYALEYRGPQGSVQLAVSGVET